nr:hypothetical protein [uncultured Azospirillum sp.]
MNKSFAERLTEHLRLVILRCLTETPADEARRFWALHALWQAPGRTANLSLIQDELTAAGCPVTRDQMRTLAAWLTEQTLCTPAGTDTVPGLRLTQRGLEVSVGTVETFGVAPPPTAAWLHARALALCLEVPRSAVDEAITWLFAEKLVSPTADGLVRLLPRAADVAAGRDVVDGIKVPSPSEMMGAAARSARATLG